MKKIILLLTTLFCVAFLHAQTAVNQQNQQLSNEDFFNKSELVIEGQYIKIVATYDTKGNEIYDDCYSITAYNVHKVYKGDTSLTGKTIYITKQGALLGWENDTLSRTITTRPNGEIILPMIEDIGYITPPVISKNGIRCGVSKYTPNILFLVTSDFPDDKNTNSKYFSYKKYKFIRNTIRMKGDNIMYVCGNIIAGLDDLIFHNREDFYKYMRQFEGFMVPEPEKQLEIKNSEPVIDVIHSETDKDKEKLNKKKAPQQTRAASENTLTLQLALTTNH